MVIGNRSGVVSELDGVLTLDRNSKISGQVITKKICRNLFKNEEILTVLKVEQKHRPIHTSRRLEHSKSSKQDLVTLSCLLDKLRSEIHSDLQHARSETDLKTQGKLDGVVTNEQQHHRNLVSVQDLGGNLYDIDITNVSVGDGTTYGYANGDDGVMTAVDDTNLIFTDVQSLRPPELNQNSGELIYIKGLGEAIQRTSEQTELFKFIFAF